MDPSVGAGSAVQLRRPPKQATQRILKHPLHRAVSGLALPAMESASVICDFQQNISHVTPDILTDIPPDFDSSKKTAKNIPSTY